MEENEEQKELISIQEFADRCLCSYENIRQKIDGEIIPDQYRPIKIDAVKYAYIIQTFENKRTNTA